MKQAQLSPAVIETLPRAVTALCKKLFKPTAEGGIYKHLPWTLDAEDCHFVGWEKTPRESSFSIFAAITTAHVYD